MGQKRISNKQSEFDIYIRRVAPWCATVVAGVTNGERLGMTAAEVVQSTGFHDRWFTGIPATPGAYELHTNPDTKTRTTRLTVTGIMKDYATFFNPLLTRINTSPAITDADRSMLNLPPRDTTSTPRAQINDAPVVNVKSMESGRMKIRTRVSEDASRASRHPLADAVEIRFQVGGTQPANANACPNVMQSRRALFTIEAGIENGEKKFYCFCRYINLSNPNNSGPWSSIQIATIQG